MHPYFFSLLYRQRLAEFERQAKYRRQFTKQKSQRVKRFVSVLSRPRRTVPTAAPVAAKARPCH